MSVIKTVKVAQFDAEVTYRIGSSPNPDAPVILLLHSFSTNNQLYDSQYDNEALTSRFNMISIDLYGHGGTRGLQNVITYWDQARMILQVMDALSIPSAFVLGTSQGGFIATRMALLEPSKVAGLVLCGTSLYSETSLYGSWDIDQIIAGALPVLEAAEPTPSFVLPQPFTDDVIGSGFGASATDAQKSQIRALHEVVYSGDEGRKRYLMIMMCLKNRDNLDSTQLGSIKCPVLILHGTEDIVYSVELMQHWSKELTAAKEVQVEVVQGGTHFLTANKPVEVDAFLEAFVTRNSA